MERTQDGRSDGNVTRNNIYKYLEVLALERGLHSWNDKDEGYGRRCRMEMEMEMEKQLGLLGLGTECTVLHLKEGKLLYSVRDGGRGLCPVRKGWF